MTHSNRSARIDHLLRSGQLSRRDLLGTLAGLGLTGALAALAPGRALAQAVQRFVGYPFTLGVASGYPRPDGFTLWTRLAPAPLQADGGIERDAVIALQWQVAEDEGFGECSVTGIIDRVGVQSPQ